MNRYNEKLPAECDVENGLRSMSEVPTNGDRYLNYFSKPDRKQTDTHYLAVNFLKNQNYTKEWSSQISESPHIPGNIFLSVENKNNSLKLIIQTGHNLLCGETAAKNEITFDNASYSSNTAETITRNSTTDELKSDYVDNSNDTTELDAPESNDSRSDKYNWLKVLGILCDVCDEIFPSKMDFDEHFKVAHAETKVSYTCSECKKNFELYHRFRNHCYRHIIGGRYKCTECTRSFSQRSYLLDHTKAFHSENSRPEGKPFVCEPCGKTFITKTGLVFHTRWHHNDRQVQYTCEECGKVLHTGSGLTAHMAAHKVGRQFMCHLCGMSFVQKCNMLLHVKRHKGSQPFLCTYCPKSFPSRSALASHVAFHNNGRQFKCSVCDKLYMTERDLKVHSLVHADKRPFECETCGKGFLTSSKLKQHSNIHTGERPYECRYCEMTFTNFPNLIKHTKKKHKVHHKTGMPIDYKDVAGKDAINSDGGAQSVISTSDDSTMSVINNSSVIAANGGSAGPGTPSARSVTASSDDSGYSFQSAIEKAMNFIPADDRALSVKKTENLGYFLKETEKKNNIAKIASLPRSEIFNRQSDGDDGDLSNIDTESVISMDLSDNSVLLYNERMENADDVLNCTFLDMADLDNPTVQECAIESNLQLDQTDLLPHNGWQKVNLQDISVDTLKRNAFNPAHIAAGEIDLNYIYANVDPSKNAETAKLPDFTLDAGMVDFIDDVNQFVDETALCENLQDQELELSHSYIREQIEGFHLISKDNIFVKTFDDVNSRINVGDISAAENNQKLPSITELYHLRPKYMNYQTGDLSSSRRNRSAEENSSKHSTQLPADVFEHDENGATDRSNESLPFGDGLSSTTRTNIDVLTANSNLSTSPIIIFNANDLKDNLRPDADFQFLSLAPPDAEFTIKNSKPDISVDSYGINITASERLRSKHLPIDLDPSIFEQSLDILTPANLSLIEDVCNSNLTNADEVGKKIFNLTQSEFLSLGDVDSNPDAVEAVNNLQSNGSYLNDFYLTAQMLTHPLILNEKSRSGNLIFAGVHPPMMLSRR